MDLEIIILPLDLFCKWEGKNGMKCLMYSDCIGINLCKEDGRLRSNRKGRQRGWLCLILMKRTDSLLWIQTLGLLLLDTSWHAPYDRPAAFCWPPPEPEPQAWALLVSESWGIGMVSPSHTCCLIWLWSSPDSGEAAPVKARTPQGHECWDWAASDVDLGLFPLWTWDFFTRKNNMTTLRDDPQRMEQSFFIYRYFLTQNLTWADVWNLLNTLLMSQELGVPVMAQWKWISLVSMRMQVRSLVSLSGLRVQCYHELWYRSPALAWLWLCYRPVAIAPIWPLAWEPPYAVDAALKRKQISDFSTLACLNSDSHIHVWKSASSAGAGKIMKHFLYCPWAKGSYYLFILLRL